MAVPSYETVPDHWKQPFGPYVQAPESFGGKWYYVSPFTGPEPWKRDFPAEELPEGFLEIFGPRPTSDGKLPAVFQRERNQWLQDLKFFKSAGPPEWATAEQLEFAGKLYEEWGMGHPLYYEGRYGFMAAFVKSQLPDYETAAHQAIEYGHFVIAQYQISLRAQGKELVWVHPFVPKETP